MRIWESHVLSNLPFYTALFPLFLDLLRTRVSSRGDAAISDLIKVGNEIQCKLHSEPDQSLVLLSRRWTFCQRSRWFSMTACDCTLAMLRFLCSTVSQKVSESWYAGKLCRRDQDMISSELVHGLQVMRAWRASPQLAQLLKEVEPELVKVTRQAGRRLEGPHAELLPFLMSQRQDWEAYALAGQSSTPLVSPAFLCSLIDPV